MKKGIFGLAALFVMGLGLSSCEDCMTCDVEYTKSNGEEVIETTPQKCGFPWELDDKEEQLEEAYSDYNDVEVRCDRQ